MIRALVLALLLMLTPATAHASPSYPTEREYIGKVYIPNDANPATTPTVLTDRGTWIPEEDPSGGYPTNIYLDNSPLYSKGWMLQINTQDNIVRWVYVQDRLFYLPDES